LYPFLHALREDCGAQEHLHRTEYEGAEVAAEWREEVVPELLDVEVQDGREGELGDEAEDEDEDLYARGERGGRGRAMSVSESERRKRSRENSTHGEDPLERREENATSGPRNGSVADVSACRLSDGLCAARGRRGSRRRESSRERRRRCCLLLRARRRSRLFSGSGSGGRGLVFALDDLACHAAVRGRNGLDDGCGCL
jgi:hypothetical protein